MVAAAAGLRLVRGARPAGREEGGGGKGEWSTEAVVGQRKASVRHIRVRLGPPSQEGRGKPVIWLPGGIQDASHRIKCIFYYYTTI